MTVGESRFDSSRGYTGAQTRLKPGQAVRVNSSYVNHYSRDDTVESSEKGSLPSDEDSMYRSVKGAAARSRLCLTAPRRGSAPLGLARRG